MKLTLNQKRCFLLLEVGFYAIVFVSIAIFALLQPFGVPPDEISRYKVVQYVCIHGRIPVGNDPEVIIGGYGASYAFQPILSYIIMGFVMRPVFFFVKNSFLLLYIARFVNVIIGVIMAFFVRKISKELFVKPSLQWVFTLLIVFLPQNLFLHSYVNTDSMAACATAIMIYACILAIKTNWNNKSCILLAVGIILCALSYYNAYGMILCSIFLFIFSFFHKDSKKLSFDTNAFLKKGIFISVLVLLGIGWWFIRNAILYDGDFIGMDARMKCAAETCIPLLHPDLKETLQNTGHSLSYLFNETLFLHTLYQSFIATFGTMDIFTYPFIYSGYKILFAGGLLCLLLPLGKSGFSYLKDIPLSTRRFFNALMVLDMIIVASLCVWYSYSWDYQPQGRYVLPLLIPLMYFISMGISKLDSFLIAHFPKGKQLSCIIQGCVIGFIVVSLFVTMFFSVLPYYSVHENWLLNALNS